MYVIFNACWAIALYCQRCGKIHIHDVSYFESVDQEISLRCGCNHLQAILVRTVSNRFQLKIPCVVCDSVHQGVFSVKSLVKMKLEKIYCARDHFELGYVGKRQKIEEILAFNKREFASMDEGNDEEQIEAQQTLLEVLNRLHDLAEQGGVNCPCGKSAIAADIVGNSVVLECCHCGSYYILSAKTETDLEKLNKMGQIDLLQGRFLVKNIDLD